MAQPAGSRPGLDHPALIAALRARVSRLEGGGRLTQDVGAIPLCDGMGLPGGGLARASLHEILATEPGCGAAFAAVVLARSGGTVVWIAGSSDGLTAWPPGLARFGLLPANLILVRADGWSDALWAMEETLRCPAVSGALLAVDWQAKPAATALDLTASRRLQLAAEAGGGIGLLLRPAMLNPPPQCRGQPLADRAPAGRGTGS